MKHIHTYINANKSPKIYIYITLRYRTYEVVKQLLEHGVKAKIIENNTEFVYSGWSHH